ncbi:hypothetical protein J2S43_001127 [Catenuloplanes nepalensis]|uniref:Uncharacterized protein n=1 Tax=Catenuloplanes nepalensis TaxID=587533 RepID=A0ABT9MMG8_9ACTN|nr:hypothetical protein [Catenuloplanes nepalensis]MDP9792615.1 hypothetical protein [Catenuloplanes nepalensis]
MTGTGTPHSRSRTGSPQTAVALRGPAPRPLPQQEIIAAYQAGTSVNSLAAQYGVARSTLANRLTDWGVPLPGRGGATRLVHPHPDRPAQPFASEGLSPGDPDGHGQWAQLTVSDDGQQLLCHECGLWKRAFGTHAWYVHGLSAADYRARHGLSTGQSLASPASQQRFAAMPQSQPGSAGRRALETHRDPHAARAAVGSEGQYRPQRAAIRAQTGARARRGRLLTAHERRALDAASADIETWSRIAQRLVDDSVRQSEISRATGVPNQTVSQRLRRRR